jgi:hypothetical protein
MLGIGFGLGLTGAMPRTSLGALGLAVPVAQDPLQLIGSTNLLTWQRDAGTLSTTSTLTSGSSPPAVVLSETVGGSGALTFASNIPGVRIECTVGGASPTIRYSADNGTTWIATISPTPGVATALTGALAGISVTCPVGTYANTHIWRYGCETWTDKSGNGQHATKGGAATTCPHPIAGSVNGQPGLQFDGSGDWMTWAGLVLPATCLHVMIFKIDTWVAARNILSLTGGTGIQIVQMGVSTPRVRMFDNATTNENQGLVVGTYGRMAAHFSNSKRDYLLAGARLFGGLDNTGRTSTTTAPRIGTNSAASSFSAITVAEHFKVARDLTAYEWTCLDMYFANRYGAITL